jgi:hypothetical protein
MIKKLVLTMMVLFATLTANAKCNWSTLKLQQWNQNNYYKWYVSGQVLDDTCVDWMFMIYDIQTNKVDTVWDNKGLCEVQFNKKGKYKMYLKVWNRCEKCDTSIMREVNLIYFTNCKFNYKMFSTSHGSCQDSISGTMSLAENRKGDTCWSYYYYMYHGEELDVLNQHDWDSMSDDQLYMYYSFNDSDIVIIEGPENKPVNYKFNKDGHYLLVTQWHNKCLGQDTFFFTRISIELCSTTGIESLVKPTPKLIEVYDMMGRKVYHIRKDEVLIYLYDDRSVKKVMVH